MTHRRRMSILVLVIVLFGVLCLTVYVHAQGDGPYVMAVCAISDTGRQLSPSASTMTLYWQVTDGSLPDTVQIEVCQNAAGNCVPPEVEELSSGYGMRVEGIYTDRVQVTLGANGLAYLAGVGWLQRGSAYIRVVGYANQCVLPVDLAADPTYVAMITAVAGIGTPAATATPNETIPALATAIATLSTPQPTATANATIPRLATAVATLSTPNPTIPALVTAVATLSTPGPPPEGTPTATLTPTATTTATVSLTATPDATYLPMILSSGNAWGLRRVVDYGDAAIALSLIVLAGIDALWLIVRVVR